MVPGMADRILLLVTTTSYRTDDFVQAARRLGLEPVVGTDRCKAVAQMWPEERFGTVEVRFRDVERAVEQIAGEAARAPLAAILPTDEQTAVVAAAAASRLGLRGNAPEAAYRARNKMEMRRALELAGVPAPRAASFEADSDPVAARHGRTFPCVLKPLLLSGSRGVIRADDPAGFDSAWSRIGAILRSHKLWNGRDAAARQLLVEDFVPGAEVALEGVLREGSLRVLALFDKPDPLDGPFFEETIYVTPSTQGADVQRRILEVTEAAARALGLQTGPVHAELRIGPAGPVVIEVAARSIGGLCSRTLRLGLAGTSLEEIVIAEALGRQGPPLPTQGASGVMMLPVPRGGVLKRVRGVRAARQVGGIEDVVITARPGEVLVPLPEGSAYPGFVFARGASSAEVVESLRAAHRALSFELARRL